MIDVRMQILERNPVLCCCFSDKLYTNVCFAHDGTHRTSAFKYGFHQKATVINAVFAERLSLKMFVVSLKEQSRHYVTVPKFQRGERFTQIMRFKLVDFYVLSRRSRGFCPSILLSATRNSTTEYTNVPFVCCIRAPEYGVADFFSCNYELMAVVFVQMRELLRRYYSKRGRISSNMGSFASLAAVRWI